MRGRTVNDIKFLVLKHLRYLKVEFHTQLVATVTITTSTVMSIPLGFNLKRKKIVHIHSESFLSHLRPEMNASIVSEYFMSYWAYRHFHILHI